MVRVVLPIPGGLEPIEIVPGEEGFPDIAPGSRVDVSGAMLMDGFQKLTPSYSLIKQP